VEITADVDAIPSNTSRPHLASSCPRSIVPVPVPPGFGLVPQGETYWRYVSGKRAVARSGYYGGRTRYKYRIFIAKVSITAPS